MHSVNETSEGEWLSLQGGYYDDEDDEDSEDRGFSVFVPSGLECLFDRSTQSSVESLINFKENWAVFEGRRYPKYWARQAVNSETLSRLGRIKRVISLYKEAASARTGALVKCPCCETEFVKAVNQKFCKAKLKNRSTCKDFFHNFISLSFVDDPTKEELRICSEFKESIKKQKSTINKSSSDNESFKKYANNSIASAKEHHAKNQSLRIGSLINCATCGKSFSKKTQKQACCSLTCNVKYQNFIRSK